MTPPRRPPPLRRLLRDERGVITPLNLFLFVTVCAVGAAAVDVTHFYAARSQLQVAADLAAHSALYTRRYGGTFSGGAYYPLTDDGAREAAIAAVRYGMPEDLYGTVIEESQIVLGNLDFATGDVVPDTVAPIEAPDAAAVLTQRADDNAVTSFLFRIVGVTEMDVNAAAVFSLGPGECNSDEGFFSQTEVDIQSNNTFWPGFCIAAPEFELQNGNWFKPGVTTTIPTMADLDIPNSDPDTHNPGLMESLAFGDYDLSAMMDLVRLDGPNSVPAHFRPHHAAWTLLGPGAWTTTPVADRAMAPTVHAGGGNFTPAQLTPGGVHVITCASTNGNNGRITLRAHGGNATFRDVVILTNCSVSLDGAIRLENAVLSSSYVSNNRPSIQVPSSQVGPTIGTDDGCAPGGGAALFTRGRFDAAAKVNFYGALVRAGGEVDFQSGAFGEGVSVMAGHMIDTNSNIEMKACGPAAGALPRDVSLRLWR